MAFSKTQEREQTELSKRPQPISGKMGARIIGPSNPTREAENPDTLVPPREDHGTLANLRWSFADSHMHLSEGGWGRQTTARELPIATEVAGCVADLVQHEWNGMVIPASDVAKLSAAMEQIATSDRRSQMAERSGQRIQAYSPAAWAAGMANAVTATCGREQ